jgi:hypothetical protein
VRELPHGCLWIARKISSMRAVEDYSRLDGPMSLRRELVKAMPNPPRMDQSPCKTESIAGEQHARNVNDFVDDTIEFSPTRLGAFQPCAGYLSLSLARSKFVIASSRSTCISADFDLSCTTPATSTMYLRPSQCRDVNLESCPSGDSMRFGPKFHE